MVDNKARTVENAEGFSKSPRQASTENCDTDHGSNAQSLEPSTATANGSVPMDTDLTDKETTVPAAVQGHGAETTGQANTVKPHGPNDGDKQSTATAMA